MAAIWPCSEIFRVERDQFRQHFFDRLRFVIEVIVRSTASFFSRFTNGHILWCYQPYFMAEFRQFA
ncbi:hypothetical protein AYO27_17785 [Rhizobium sp. GHKF11]|nr:hypothetical protein AYO27_17785 [Rhizobium sp. GHKF11]